MIHEGSPAIIPILTSQLIEGVPLLRRLSPLNAFSEGGRFIPSESPKPIWFYDDDPSVIGTLTSRDVSAVDCR